jgi:phenylalanyl-tRNA synthetase alpha chain
MTIPDIEGIARAAREQIETAQTTAELEAARVQHLGRAAQLVLLLREIPNLPPEHRSIVGKDGNKARGELERLVAQRVKELEAAELELRLQTERTDPTLPPRSLGGGSLHLLTQTSRQIEDIFIGMGYQIAEGPEVDSEYYNFTALNTPEGHPARSVSDTFYIDGGTKGPIVHGDETQLLRAQTSTVQARVMQSGPPPVYVISPGRVYRRDDVDATHLDQFHQVELLAVDYGLTLAHLKGTIETFCQALFGEDLQIRMRTHFFPFTEPSVEVDLSCFLCSGTGNPAPGDDLDRCRLCRGVGWVELGGAGMVDPNVFAFFDGYHDAPQVDGQQLSGFAFGFGLERIAALRNSIPDVRILLENDIRFLDQFPAYV